MVTPSASEDVRTGQTCKTRVACSVFELARRKVELSRTGYFESQPNPGLDRLQMVVDAASLRAPWLHLHTKEGPRRRPRLQVLNSFLRMGDLHSEDGLLRVAS